MALPIELEIELSRLHDDVYAVRSRLTNPSSKIQPDIETGEIEFSTDHFTSLRSRGDLEAYAQGLSAATFDGAAGLLRSQYNKAFDLAGDLDVRVRLLIDEGAPKLQHLLWETLIDPRSEGGRLCANPRVLFSRALQRVRPRQFTLRHKYQIRVLVVIANPRMPQGLAPPYHIDVAHERLRAETGLKELDTDIIASTADAPGTATLDAIVRKLESKAYDVLYLVCHGSLDTVLVDSRLHLESADGMLDRVAGKEFVTKIERLRAAPSLIMLCSCESAGPGADAPSADIAEAPAEVMSQRMLTELGPRLVQAGIPAVLAMQGKLRMATADTFFPELFRHLTRTGTIDSAVSAARSKIERNVDFYVPVLFQRVRSGQLWYGTHEEPPTDVNWLGLLEDIKNGRGTVVIGSALLDPYVGAQSEMATLLARKFEYPFGDTERDDLAMVGEYAASIGRNGFQTSLVREWLRQIVRDHPQAATADVRENEDNDPASALNTALRAAWTCEVARKGDAEPHTALASIPFKAYLSTNPDDLIEEALHRRQVNGVNVVHIGRNPSGRKQVAFPEKPSTNKPLVAYLYGTLSDPNSLVLTEEDYYQQLITAAKGEVYTKEMDFLLTSSALVFLGFRLHEWDFRILYRRLKLIEGWPKHSDFNHVAVQIDPSTTRGTANEQTVRRFLSHFFASNKIEVFRGSIETFVSELRDRCRASGITLRPQKTP